jgi:hypothetical protein
MLIRREEALLKMNTPLHPLTKLGPPRPKIQSRLTNNSDRPQNFWNGWWLPLQKEKGRLDKLDAPCIEKFRQKVPRRFREQLQALENHHLPLERRQSPVDSLQERGNINEIVEYTRGEYKKLMNDLDNTLQATNLSQAETAKLEQSLKMLGKWHDELKSLDELSSWSQDYDRKLQSIEKLEKVYKYWRETEIIPSSFTEGFGLLLSSARSFISSVWQTVAGSWNSGEPSTSSNTERSEIRRRMRASRPPSGW